MFFSSFLFPALLARRTEGEPPVGVVSGILARIFGKHPLNKKETTDGIPRNSKGFPPPKWRCSGGVFQKEGNPCQQQISQQNCFILPPIGPTAKTPLTLVTKGPPALLTSGSPLVALGHPWVTSDTPEQRHTTGPTVNSNAGNIHRLMKMPCRLPQPCNSQIDNFVQTFHWKMFDKLTNCIFDLPMTFPKGDSLPNKDFPRRLVIGDSLEFSPFTCHHAWETLLGKAWELHQFTKRARKELLA